MSREVRRVPAHWEHPKNEKGYLEPLFGASFSAQVADWDEGIRQWGLGFRRTYFPEGWAPKDHKYATMTYEEYEGKRPDERKYMPEWSVAERTCYQMYETVSGGSPISPVMGTPEALARWLVDNAFAFSGHRASYKSWLAMITGSGWAPSAVGILGGETVSGVEWISRE